MNNTRLPLSVVKTYYFELRTADKFERGDMIMMGKPLILSIKIVIRDRDGRCLLLRRSMSSKGNAGKWEFPGGKVTGGESFDAALLREIFEETGLTVSIKHAVGTVESDLPTRKVIYLILEGYLESGEVRLSEEHQEYAWIERKRLSEMDLCEQFIPFVKEYSLGDCVA